jgi:NAD(P)-dependent dehydrogenase (short-subunit alcohol dehydrogenase family)
MSSMGLEGKVILMTGGSGGLGQSVIPAFVSAGARVIAGDLQPLSRPPAEVTPIKVDVTDEVDVHRLVDEAIRTFGRVDALVNLVGGFAEGRVVDTNISTWQRMLTMNLTSAFLLSKAVLPHMLERRTGRILHIAARAALVPFPGAAAYIVSKSGLIALIRTLSLELGESGVTVNGILPNTIDTPGNRKAMPNADPSKWVKPDVIAQTLVFLASDGAHQINGALIPIG